jgi:hypothetical protein
MFMGGDITCSFMGNLNLFYFQVRDFACIIILFQQKCLEKFKYFCDIWRKHFKILHCFTFQARKTVQLVWLWYLASDQTQDCFFQTPYRMYREERSYLCDSGGKPEGQRPPERVDNTIKMDM